MVFVSLVALLQDTENQFGKCSKLLKSEGDKEQMEIPCPFPEFGESLSL